ncbi:MAG: hypothetical protein JNM56_16070 [Planctomycetia bacterium]|nr:hypothetical protein [Planctomycetia bacterium]
MTLNPVIAAHRAGWQFKFAESQVARLAPGYFLYRAIIFCERPDGSRAALWPPRNGGPRKRSTFPIGEPWHRNAAGNHSNRKLQTHSARKIAFYLNAIGRDALAWERDEAGGETGKTRGAART